MKKLNKQPRFSIVIPCYNEAAFITETIRSIKRQDFNGSYEIIVVDNNCSDATAAIALDMGAKVVTETNAGVCWARQAGAEAASGEIIISTDADTTFSDNWLSTIDAWFTDHPQAIAIAGACHYKDGPLWGRLYTHGLFGFVQFLYTVTGHTLYASATNIAFKASAFTGYDTSLTQGGDEVGLLKSLRRNGQVIFTNVHPTQTSGRRLQKGLLYNFFVTFLFYYFLEYNLSRLLKVQLIGAAPAFRSKNLRATPYASLAVTGLAALAIFTFALPMPRHHFAHVSYEVADKLSEEVTHRDLL